MGSKTIQGQLWDKNPEDWANIQERTGEAGYHYILEKINVDGLALLDIGCGSGLFSDKATAIGALVTGLDASEQLIKQAQIRNSNITFIVGEMEELPFPEHTFDIVSGFNSFQYAANISQAFLEAKRVLKTGGKLLVMIWGNKEDCEAASYLKAVGSLLPLPQAGAPGPFALSEDQHLERTLEKSGFNILESTDVASTWDYPNVHIAIKGLMSAGPVSRAVDHSGFEKVLTAVQEAVKPYIKDNGHVVYQNRFRIVIGEKA